MKLWVLSSGETVASKKNGPIEGNEARNNTPAGSFGAFIGAGNIQLWHATKPDNAALTLVIRPKGMDAVLTGQH
jgi:hypothetical protein